ILFLDATDEELVSRYKETRRSHPLAKQGRIIDGIREERNFLNEIRLRAGECIDTTHTTPRELRQQLMDKLGEKESEPFHVEMVSFGFKNGLPIDGDIVMDVRCLPNPHNEEDLRELRGTDEEGYDFGMRQSETEDVYNLSMDLINYTLPGYRREGKSSLPIAIGCTGG